MACENVVVIGASAGGLEALKVLIPRLPVDLPAAVIVVLHLSARSDSWLASILDRLGPLRALQPEDGDVIEHGRIYVAPPDRHLLVSREHVHLHRGPKEGRQRPSINVTFRSVARSFGAHSVGVILSGMLDDGTAGMWEIKRRGGITIIQDPNEAGFPSMPVSVLQDVEVDHQSAVADIGPLIARILSERGGAGVFSEVLGNRAARRIVEFTCPECRGPMFESDPGKPLEFCCRVGHFFSPAMLLDEHTSNQERKLYEAVLALDEGADIAEYLAARKVTKATRERLMSEAEQLREYSKALQEMIQERFTAPIELIAE